MTCFQNCKYTLALCNPEIYGYLLKHGTTWNNLQRSQTTYNKQETTWNGLQRARNDLKRSTTSKKQPTTIRNDQQQAKKDAKPPTTSRFWDYFTVWDNAFHPTFD